ncbi:MAG: RNA 2',3'-cyclic phosphodiesterase [Gammaproteobacteria bacterium]|nr:RNA 2',3'-cyclic phosphodiesterase [Gammaproteobacteria bacterium]MCW5582733.1 RNA 2',3'-cyclic phosphodiesterase [Gammaproteobacteria bacterium]
MTLPPVIRVFFAIDLSESIKEKLGSFISILKKKSRSYGIRWAKPENLHITLQFLPEVKMEHLPVLNEKVRAEINEAAKISNLALGSLHLFPSPYRPRVIVLDIIPQDELVILSGRIGEGIKAANYEIENRPFRAHLTLGRIKQPQEMNLSFLSECKAPEVEKIDVSEIVLFRSEPQPEGSKYTVMEKITLN